MALDAQVPANITVGLSEAPPESFPVERRKIAPQNG